MQYSVPLQGVEVSQVKVELPGLFSGAKLVVNGMPAPKAAKRGEYIIHRDDGSQMTARLKNKFLDPVPDVVINGETIKIVDPLKWYQWIWAGLPILLIFVGGLLGAGLGLVATSINTRIFRSDTIGVGQYAQVALLIQK